MGDQLKLISVDEFAVKQPINHNPIVISVGLDADNKDEDYSSAIMTLDRKHTIKLRDKLNLFIDESSRRKRKDDSIA